MSKDKNQSTQESAKEVSHRTIQLKPRQLDTLQRMHQGIQDIEAAEASFLTGICIEQYEYPEDAGLGFEFNFATGEVQVVEYEVSKDEPKEEPKKKIES